MTGVAAIHCAIRRAAPALLGSLLVWAPAPAPGAEARYVRAAADYRPPDVTLVDQAGAPVRLGEALAGGGPVLLQFIFTTCSTICPVMSGTFAAVQETLPEARLVSISIDPEVDTPARLAEYARRFGAGPRWRLLGGRLDDVIAIEQAFDAYRGNKMRHEPLTFVHTGPERPWLRLEGFPSAAELAAEVRQAGREAASAVERGRRIYRDGVLPSGRPLRGLVQGDVPVAGTRLACASCHRPSGFGGVEGGTLVPPVTGPALFSGAEPSAAELFGKLYQEELSPASWTRLRAARDRPAYTAASLAAALRHGTGPDGRALDPTMPRYELEAADLDDLAAYLRTLAATPAPGVEAKTVHFAVVVAPDVDEGSKRAMLDVVAAYFRYRNAETRHLLDRPAPSPGTRANVRETWREWVLHVWQLAGPPATWTAQLARSYGEQPVFALLSGLGAGEWQPVHDFCERTAVPCVFPNVDLPVAAPAGAWNLYLSAGLTLEARALGRHLAAAVPRAAAAHSRWAGDTTSPPVNSSSTGAMASASAASAASFASPAAVPEAPPAVAAGRPARIVQVFRDRPEGRVPAAALREALRGVEDLSLADLALGAGAGGLAAVAVKLRALGGAPSGGPAALAAPAAPLAVVLWLDRGDLEALAPAIAASGAAAIYLSYSLLGEELPPPEAMAALPPALRGHTFLTFRYALPGNPAPQARRARGWLLARGVAATHERLELDTLFTLAAADDALDRMAGRFSRDYFVETLEREVERAANPGVYPRLGLGAGQRFASHGCYVVRAAPEAAGGLAAASDWIVP